MLSDTVLPPNMLTIKYDLMKQKKKLISAMGMDRSVRVNRQNNTDWFLKELAENFDSRMYFMWLEQKVNLESLCCVVHPVM